MTRLLVKKRYQKGEVNLKDTLYELMTYHNMTRGEALQYLELFY
jgi:hypothetical protein